MKRFLGKLKLYIRYFIKVKKNWRFPKNRDVLLFDDAGRELLMSFLRQYDPEILDLNNSLNIPIFITSLFRKGKRDYAYLDCFIEKVRPKLVITFTDNNPAFYLLRSRHPSIRTIFIQNGVRTYYADCFELIDSSFSSVRRHFHVDHMLTFGANIMEKYKECIRGQGTMVGSIKNNQNQRRVSKIPNSIGFVSQFREAEGIWLGKNYISWEKHSTQMDKIILFNLSKYVQKNHKSLFIIPCAAKEGNEIALKERTYYKNILGWTPEFFEGYDQGMNSYDAVDAAEVVVGIDSALLYESAARHNKTGFFSFRGRLLNVTGLDYGWPGNYPQEGLFWSNKDNYESFQRIMDNLFALNEEGWLKALQRYSFDNVMFYDPGNARLKRLLEDELAL